MASALFLWGCTETKPTTTSYSERVSPTYDGPSEPTYCSNATNYSGGITVSGKATFIVRNVIPSGSYKGLSDPDSSNPKPVRFAEIRVLDSSDTVVQCGETDTNGNYSLKLPQGSSNLTIHIMARAFNSNVKVSVLNSPEYNVPYSVTKSVKPDSDQTVNIKAGATGSILGGAFNIYDQILNVNEYIRDQLSSNFVANKVQAYWEKGFNPGYYVNTDSQLSYYYPGTDRLFILGGDDGDTDSSDTDHYDNSVIIHEYGHFLEDNYAVSNSPGGPHSGTKQIDARLAWSEGFANFLNAAVRVWVSGDPNDANYVDTLGTPDGATTVAINIDLESYDGCENSTAAGCDRADSSGEAIFREFAISRFLYDAVDNTPTETDTLGSWNAASNNPTLSDATGVEGDTYVVSLGGTKDLGSGNLTFVNGDLVYHNGTQWQKNPAAANFDNISGMFEEIWNSLKSNDGFKSSATSFRDIGLLNYIEEEAGGTSWDQLRSFHRFPNDTSNNRELRREYAYQVDTIANGASSCTGLNFSMDPVSDSNDYQNSDLHLNNEFFYYQHSGGSLSLTLRYKTASGTEANLDLLVYFDEGPFGYSYERSDGVVFPYIASTYPDGNSGDTESETINLGNQPAGDYLINVYALGGVGNATTFELKVGSTKLCPKNLNL